MPETVQLEIVEYGKYFRDMAVRADRQRAFRGTARVIVGFVLFATGCTLGTVALWATVWLLVPMTELVGVGWWMIWSGREEIR